jgi:hypothetical protein
VVLHLLLAKEAARVKSQNSGKHLNCRLLFAKNSLPIMQFKALTQGMALASCLLPSVLCQEGNNSMPVFTPELNTMRTISVGFVSIPWQFKNATYLQWTGHLPWI